MRKYEKHVREGEINYEIKKIGCNLNSTYLRDFFKQVGKDISKYQKELEQEKENCEKSAEMSKKLADTIRAEFPEYQFKLIGGDEDTNEILSESCGNYIKELKEEKEEGDEYKMNDFKKWARMGIITISSCIPAYIFAQDYYYWPLAPIIVASAITEPYLETKIRNRKFNKAKRTQKFIDALNAVKFE